MGGTPGPYFWNQGPTCGNLKMSHDLVLDSSRQTLSNIGQTNP